LSREIGGEKLLAYLSVGMDRGEMISGTVFSQVSIG
jgi:hypothetical protein